MTKASASCGSCTPLVEQLLKITLGDAFKAVFWSFLGALYPQLSLGIPFGPEFASAETNDLIPVLGAVLLGLGLNEAAGPGRHSPPPYRHGPRRPHQEDSP